MPCSCGSPARGSAGPIKQPKPNPASGVILHGQEETMSIMRLIFITIDPSDTERAMQVWKKECAPLMIQQKGCMSERLLRSREAHEFISWSEWESEADIAMYGHSDAHQEIVRHTRALKGAKAQVKLYEVVS